MATDATTRLFVILARKARRAVIFRRGPTREVRLILWERKTRRGPDTFLEGQWLKGRVYERRCDLSPSGHLLIYFVGKHVGTHPTYSAVSRPPYFTALALWPKGDAWAGGGSFSSDYDLQLNHRPDEAELAAGFATPRLRVIPDPRAGGEDDPLYHQRLLRDGWLLQRWEEPGEFSWKTWASWVHRTPRVYQKPAPAAGRRWRLEMHLLALGERQGEWYVLEFTLEHEKKGPVALGRLQWGDWDANGDLLFSRDGSLYRLAAADLGQEPMERALLLTDFSHQRFESVGAPASAQRW